ncbi:MAG: DMT family transporter [Campylobacteraceae bacterium]|nr:DMT family transporter [Campylobacteraceae bacterium]
MASRLKRFGADMSLLAVAIVWGSTFLIVQDAIKQTPVYTFLFWRFLLAAVLMAVFSVKHIQALDKRTLFAGFVLGAFLFLGYVFQTFGLVYTYSSTVGFITGLNVVIIPFVLLIIFRKKVSFYSCAGAIAAALGLYFLSANAHVGMGKGEFYAFICAVMFSLQIVFTGFYTNKHDTHSLVFVQFCAVSVFCFFGIFALNNPLLPPTFDSLFIKAVVITSVFATVFAFFIQTAMQKFTSSAKTAIIFTCEPVAAGVVGYFFANEAFTPAQFVGAVLIIIGMLAAEIGEYAVKKIKTLFCR